jgi:hypothetical protein
MASCMKHVSTDWEYMSAATRCLGAEQAAVAMLHHALCFKNTRSPLQCQAR